MSNDVALDLGGTGLDGISPGTQVPVGPNPFVDSARVLGPLTLAQVASIITAALSLVMWLLLVVALTFTMLSLALKARYASRYRGA